MNNQYKYIKGADDAIAALLAMPARLRNQGLRNVLAAGARVLRDEAKRRVPVLRAPIVRKSTPAGVIRKPGTVRNAIKVRTSKNAKRNGDVGVFVNVKPAPKGSRGAYNPNDPFYWRWLEFGRKGRAGVSDASGFRRVGIKTRVRKARRGVAGMPAYRFLQGAASKASEALAKITQQFGPVVEKLNKKRGL